MFSNITLAAKWITGRQEEILGDHLESGCSRANNEGAWIRMIAEWMVRKGWLQEKVGYMGPCAWLDF